jgi:hypothetical protein
MPGRFREHRFVGPVTVAAGLLPPLLERGPSDDSASFAAPGLGDVEPAVGPFADSYGAAATHVR